MTDPVTDTAACCCPDPLREVHPGCPLHGHSPEKYREPDSAASWPQRPWRVGRKVGRTIYERKGDRPSDDDPLIGVMDTPELAGLVVLAVNLLLPEEHR